jgi:hypothetical protein
VAVVLALLLGGCQAGQQVRVPRLGPPPEGVALDPPPPAGLHWLRIVSAQVPEADAAGRRWDDAQGLPDPYVVLLVEGNEVMRTPAVEDSLTPVWSGQGGTFDFRAERPITVRLVDDDGVTSQTIGEAELPPPGPEQRASGSVDLELGPNVQVRLAVRTPPALFGLGMTYRFVAGQCHVTSLFEHGPAGRAGLVVGDRIDQVGGRPVAELSAAELRSAFLSVPMDGLQLQVVHQAAGTTETVRLPEGPVYPLHGEQDLVD